jgi:NADH-quinone oxidoreductase subunit C
LTSRTGGDRQEIEPRFHVSIQLHSLEHEARVRVRIPVSSDDASLPSCTGLWPGANFMERECYDMFGIRFDGHPNLKRLLMPEGYGHHPLRKDFPHKGIEPDRLYREWDRERRKAQAATEGEAR